MAYQTDNQLKFRLLATEDQFPTPSRLHAWGAKDCDGMCPLGCQSKGSLRHILTMCQIGEEPQCRITWRHDSVLFAIFRAVFAVVMRLKKSQTNSKLKGLNEVETITVNRFRSEAGTVVPLRVPARKAELAQATDWDLRFDINVPEYEQAKDRAFPEEILAGVS